MTTSQQDGTMIDRMAQFDLFKEIADSEQKKPWQSGHNARTLFKKHDFRIVLITMEDGARMNQHHADGTIALDTVITDRTRLVAAIARRLTITEKAVVHHVSRLYEVLGTTLADAVERSRGLPLRTDRSNASRSANTPRMTSRDRS